MATFDFWNIVKLGGRLVVRGFTTPIAAYLVKCGLIAGLISSFYLILSTLYSSYYDLFPSDLASQLFSLVDQYDSNIGYIILYSVNINSLCTAIYTVIQMILTFVTAFFTFIIAFSLFLRTDGAKRALIQTQQQLTGKLFG